MSKYWTVPLTFSEAEAFELNKSSDEERNQTHPEEQIEENHPVSQSPQAALGHPAAPQL